MRKDWAGLGAKTAFVGFVLTLAAGQQASADTIILNFDDLSGMTFFAGAAIPAASQLSNQYLSADGVSFSSGSPYVAVVDLGVGHATSGTNGIGESTPQGILAYNRSYPITATFFDPSNPAINATTDYVSLRGDHWGDPSQNATLNAFDIKGNLIATFTTADVGGETLSVSAPGIHSIQFLGSAGDFGGVAVDDFTFHTVSTTPLPPPWTMMLIGLVGLGFAATRGRRRANLVAA